MLTQMQMATSLPDADIIAEVTGALNVSVEDDEADDDFSDEPQIFPVAYDIERVITDQ